MNDAAQREADRGTPAPGDFPWPTRIKMLLLNCLPLGHLLLLSAVALSEVPVAQRLLEAVFVLYVLPPLLARAVTAVLGRPQGRIAPGSGAFLVWWATAQLQMPFNRFPMLDELLRLVPGLYSAWLRAWGARIGRLTFWAPGVTVLDRAYLAIGDDVVFGAGVRLNGHVLMRNASGRPELAVASIRIGDGASIGGYSLLTAGNEIAAGENTRAHLLLPPFTVWREGRRWRGDSANGEE